MYAYGGVSIVFICAVTNNRFNIFQILGWWSTSFNRRCKLATVYGTFEKVSCIIKCLKNIFNFNTCCYFFIIIYILFL